MGLRGLRGRRALVTGAASGIGRAVVQRLQATAAFIDALPLRRAGKPQDIAGVVAMLCSEAGGYVSGATIDVNGGWYFGP